MPRIAFISAMEATPWGGSELLWSEAAIELARAQHNVLASVKHWPQPATNVKQLTENNIQVKTRADKSASHIRGINKIRRLLTKKPQPSQADKHWQSILDFSPNLICISQGSIACGVKWAMQCMEEGIPYALVAQSNTERYWPTDAECESIKNAYFNSEKNFFVSKANKKLLEKQIGYNIPNSHTIRNPFSVSYQSPPPWPSEEHTYKFACVGRLEPCDKGQDLLLEALGSKVWRDRPFHLSLFGNGSCRETIRRMINKWGLTQKVSLVGHVSDVEEIWKNNHMLILPSRSEGLPLALVEACLCERVVVTTDIAGNAELLEDNVNAFIAEAPTTKHLLDAMERAWQNRKDWSRIGQLAGSAVRKSIPPDPGSVFAEQLLKICQNRGNPSKKWTTAV